MRIFGRVSGLSFAWLRLEIINLAKRLVLKSLHFVRVGALVADSFRSLFVLSLPIFQILFVLLQLLDPVLVLIDFAL